MNSFELDESKTETVSIGNVSVDSGTLLIADPSYLDLWEPNVPVGDIAPDAKPTGEFNCKGAAMATRSSVGGNVPIRRQDGSLFVEASLAVSTGFGDGVYEVMADLIDGRVARIWIDFIGE